MKNKLFLSVLFLVLFSSVSFASIPDADVVKGRWEISGFTGLHVIPKETSGGPNDIRYQWQSIEIDYGSSDDVGVGIGFWSQNYLDDKYFSTDWSDFFAAMLFPWVPKYIDYAADIHFRNQFIREKEGAWLDGSWVFGLGIAQGQNTVSYTINWIYPEFGAAFSKKFLNDVMIIRTNLVVGMPGGIELGIKPIENLEFTIGTNGIYNVKFIF